MSASNSRLHSTSNTNTNTNTKASTALLRIRGGTVVAVAVVQQRTAAC
jgi:hypothetical protein